MKKVIFSRFAFSVMMGLIAPLSTVSAADANDYIQAQIGLFRRGHKARFVPISWLTKPLWAIPTALVKTRRPIASLTQKMHRRSRRRPLARTVPEFRSCFPERLNFRRRGETDRFLDRCNNGLAE